MHFSIPETSDQRDVNQGNFTVYHLHANGILHCKLRFRQFNNLHEQLKKKFGIYSLPYFPPKQFFSLKEVQIEERRASLEKYMQIISQDERISNSSLFNDFLLNAQQSTLNAIREAIKLNVLLGDNSHLNLQIMSTDNSNLVKETICRELKLPIKYTPCFSLFIVKEKESNCSTLNHRTISKSISNRDGQFINSSKMCTNQEPNKHAKYVLIRKMMDFESPYLSLKNSNLNQNVYHLKLIKFYWDVNLDDKLIENEVALNLLYMQLVHEFDQQSSELNRDQCQYLASLALRQSKKEYVMFAKCVKNYGLIRFEECICDFPRPNTKCQISIKSSELILRTFLDSFNGRTTSKDFILRITRIRCWRLTTGLDFKQLNHSNHDNRSNYLKVAGSLNSLNSTHANTFLNSSTSNDLKYELSVEYLISKDDLRWIVINSEQAVLMSTCLKSVIEELVLKKNNIPLYDDKSGEIKVDLRKNSCNYYKSNDINSSLGMNMISDNSIDLVTGSLRVMEKSLSETVLNDSNESKNINTNKYINEPKNSNKNRRVRLVHNNVYDGIGHDDL